MAAITWDDAGKRFYETGVSKGVLFPKTGSDGAYANGVAWNGLISVSEKPSGAEASAIYADNIKYLNLMSNEEFEGTIEAYTYPDEFAVCDGSVEVTAGLFFTQQARKEFGLSYVTKVGNDATPDAGYKIHLVYGALASPTEKAYETVNSDPDAMSFSWDFTTTPVNVTEVEGIRPVAHIVIDSRDFTESAAKAKLAAFEKTLYGDSTTEPTLPSPDEVYTALKA